MRVAALNSAPAGEATALGVAVEVHPSLEPEYARAGTMTDGAESQKAQLGAGEGPRGTLRLVQSLPIPKLEINPRDTVLDPRRHADEEPLPPDVANAPPPARAHIGRGTQRLPGASVVAIDAYARTLAIELPSSPSSDAASSAAGSSAARSSAAGASAAGEPSNQSISQVLDRFDPRTTGRFVDASPMLVPGERAGNYEITGFIAAGGFAEIYEAFHPIFQQKVAIKVLKREFAARKDLAYRMEVEARTLAEIGGHKHIVRVFDSGRDPNVGVWIAMELLEGQTLRDIITNAGALNLVDAIAITIFLAHAVHDLHEIGIIHRDLKPENVFVKKDPKAPDGWSTKLLDLGIVRKKGNPSISSRTLGTPLYMSPEQARHGKVVPASDQYSVNLILEEMLSGGHVWEDDADQLLEGEEVVACTWHYSRDIERRPAVPETLWPIMQRAFSKDPDERYATMKEYAQALERYLEEHVGRRVDVEDHVAVLAARVDGLVKKAKASASEDVARMRKSMVGGPVSVSPRTTALRSPPAGARVKGPIQAVELGAEYATPTLVIGRDIEFPQAGCRFPVREEMTLGRDAEQVDVMLDEPSISRAHVALKRAPGSTPEGPIYEAVDLKSTNGMKIDGVPTTSGLLRPGQTLRLGDVDLCIVPPGRIDPATGRYETQKTRVPAETRPVARSSGERTSDAGGRGSRSSSPLVALAENAENQPRASARLTLVAGVLLGLLILLATALGLRLAGVF